jgi:hypothetical protein
MTNFEHYVASKLEPLALEQDLKSVKSEAKQEQKPRSRTSSLKVPSVKSDLILSKIMARLESPKVAISGMDTSDQGPEDKNDKGTKRLMLFQHNEMRS